VNCSFTAADVLFFGSHWSSPFDVLLQRTFMNAESAWSTIEQSDSRKHRDPFGIQFIERRVPSLRSRTRQRIFQDTQVLRNGLARDWQACRKLVHCLRMVASISKMASRVASHPALLIRFVCKHTLTVSYSLRMFPVKTFFRPVTPLAHGPFPFVCYPSCSLPRLR